MQVQSACESQVRTLHRKSLGQQFPSLKSLRWKYYIGQRNHKIIQAVRQRLNPVSSSQGQNGSWLWNYIFVEILLVHLLKEWNLWTIITQFEWVNSWRSNSVLLECYLHCMLICPTSLIVFYMLSSSVCWICYHISTSKIYGLCGYPLIANKRIVGFAIYSAI